MLLLLLLCTGHDPQQQGCIHLFRYYYSQKTLPTSDYLQIFFFQLMITNKLTSFLKGGSLYKLDGCTTRYYTVTFRFMAFLSLNNKINEICIVFSWWHLWVSFQLLKLAKKTLLETLTIASWWISLWGHRIYIQRFLGKPSVCVNGSVQK